MWPHSVSSVAFFLENQAEKEERSGFLFPLKMSPTLTWYFTLGFEPSDC